jgi:hypothetical protein
MLKDNIDAFFDADQKAILVEKECSIDSVP